MRKYKVKYKNKNTHTVNFTEAKYVYVVCERFLFFFWIEIQEFSNKDEAFEKIDELKELDIYDRPDYN